MDGLPEMPIKNVRLVDITVKKANETSVITNVENLQLKNVVAD
jgi:hypothetical protein